MKDNLHILTDEQLVKMAQEGSETAEEILLEKYKAVAKSKAQLYYMAGADSEDVVQEGMIGLFKAVRSYEEGRGVAFKTFANTCMNNQIISAIKKANRQKHRLLNESLSFDAQKTGEEGEACAQILKASFDKEPESMLLIKEVMDYLHGANDGMFSNLEWEILQEKLKGKEAEEIASDLGKPVKSVTNALQRIKKKIVAYLEK